MRIIAVLPAYNAAKSLKTFFINFPFEVFDEVILVDDASLDIDRVIREIRVMGERRDIRVFQNARNLGYGGNLKRCLGIALERGADVIVEIHPDGEYGFDGIAPGIALVKKGAKFVLGDRFSGDVIRSGMPVWKYPFTKGLSWVGNLILGTNIPDLHQGFRIYTKDLLGKINYRACSNNYLFSFQVIALSVFKKIPIASVPVSVSYKGSKRGAALKSSIFYSLGVLGTLGRFGLLGVGSKKGIFSKESAAAVCPVCQTDFLVYLKYKLHPYSLFYCQYCQVGFLEPVSKDLSKFYPRNYWVDGSLIGQIKKAVFEFFQSRRSIAVKSFLKQGRILDIGSGEGEFAKSLSSSYQVTSLEAAFSTVNNPQVLKTDFLKFNPRLKFEAITFWESLEHVSDPEKYLNQAAKLLKDKGLVFIEYPRFNCLEHKLFGKDWFHLDPPRHLFHFSDQGIKQLAEKLNFRVLEQYSVPAFEYSVWGFFISATATLGFLINHHQITSKQFLKLIWLSPVMALAFIAEIGLYLFNESPIGLVVLEKK